MRVGWSGVAALLGVMSGLMSGCGSGGTNGGAPSGGAAGGGAAATGGSAGTSFGGLGGAAAAAGSSGTAGSSGVGASAGSGGSSVGGAGGSSASCTSGTQPCFSGDPQLIDVGLCTAGLQSCDSGAWGACTGEVLPDIEDCALPTDENCDGKQCEVWRTEGLQARFLAATPSDDVVFGGTFSGSVQIGSNALQAHGFSDAWIGSFELNGAPKWVYQTTGADTEDVYGLAVGSSGEVSATIDHFMAVDFGDGVKPPGNSLVHLGSNGAFRWSFGFGTARLSWVAVDASGATYAAGYFDEAVTLGGQTLTPQATDALVLKLDATGKLVWLKQFGGSGDDYFEGVALAPNGDLVLLGGETGGVDFGGGSSISYGNLDNVVVALTPDGDYRQSLVFGSASDDYAVDLASDAQGRFAVSFLLPADIQFGSETLQVPSPGDGQIGVARLSLDGSGFSVDWTSLVPFFSKSIAVDPSGNVVVAGGKSDVARVAKLGAQGQSLWEFAPDGLEFVEGVTCASTGEVLFGAKYTLSTSSTSVEAFSIGKLGK
ncbi:MAG: hypothetical protein R3B89_23465 [Polyangiaceae bacterium]